MIEAGQVEYWNRVARSKTFTHPLSLEILKADRGAKILDYGCGYGRIVAELKKAGYDDVVGVDTSSELVAIGDSGLDLRCIEHAVLPFADDSFDYVTLIAVLTCIPANQDQQQVIAEIARVLKPGGAIYVSDYLLQPAKHDIYEQYVARFDNYGTFVNEDGAVFRHHEFSWFHELFAGFKIGHLRKVGVTTLSGRRASAVQFMAHLV